MAISKILFDIKIERFILNQILLTLLGAIYEFVMILKAVKKLSILIESLF